MKLKRLAAPKFWPIKRKSGKFIITPIPGPHKNESNIPIGILLRDVLKYASDLKEVKEMLNKKSVKIDGKVIKNYRFPVGLMDIIEIGDEAFRAIPSMRGLGLRGVEKDESGIKLLKIINKKHLRGGKIQLNCHDGRNILVDKDVCKTGDVLIYDLNKGVIKDILKYKRGSIALVTGGRNTGDVGEIEETIIARGSQANKVIMKIGGVRVETKNEYVFVLGNEKPVVKID